MQKAAPSIDSDDVRGRRQGHYHYRCARNPLITLVFLNRASSPSPHLQHPVVPQVPGRTRAFTLLLSVLM